VWPLGALTQCSVPFQLKPYRKQPAMSAADRCVSLKPNTLMRCKARPQVFDNKSVSSLQVIPTRSLPVRIAIIGNHLPRPCGIATFTTDLCNAITVEYGAAGVLVVA